MGGLFLCGKSHFRATGDMCRGVKVGGLSPCGWLWRDNAPAKKTFKKEVVRKRVERRLIKSVLCCFESRC